MIVSERNGTRIVTTDAGRGYVQHAYLTRGGRSYYSRTYYDGKSYRVGLYRGYNYGGHQYYGYYPGNWYHPGFYGWAYHPWGAPVRWGAGIGGWGWAGTRWYGYYGGYFAPYPVYSSAAYWLTDYLIAADLQAAYAAQAGTNADNAALGYDEPQAGDANSGSPALTPEVKQAIADEVKAQLAAEQLQSAQSSDSSDAQAQSGQTQDQAQDSQAQAPASANPNLPSALDPARRTFVVPSNITVTADGQECELTPGDIITRLTDTPDADQNLTAIISASKKKDCALDKKVVVSLDALQEMRNHFDEQLDSGIKMLAEKQGTGGLPKAPDTAQTASDVPPPPPDTTAAKDLSDQEAAADHAEMQANQEAAEQPAAMPIPKSTQGNSLGDIARRLREQKAGSN